MSDYVETNPVGRMYGPHAAGAGESAVPHVHSHHHHHHPQQQQQQHQARGPPPPPPPAALTRLTAKPHAFAGAVLSPKHARDLNPTLCMAITSSLAEQQNHSNSTTSGSTGTNANSKISDSVPYTLWITEAWRVLGWAEPSAALFWEMTTLFAALQAAGRECYTNADSYYYQHYHHQHQHHHRGSYPSSSQHTGSHNLQQQRSSSAMIPPILSCGSTGSMTSGATSSHAAGLAEKQKKFSSAVSAKELPVWLVGTFLLLHCEEFACQRSLSGEDERRFAYNNTNAGVSELHQATTANTTGGGRMDFSSLFRHQSLSPRCVLSCRHIVYCC
jgi:TBCC domain-containing protein 1